MDRLPSFGYAEQVRVPYECEHVFQGSFFDYPIRRGWDMEKLLHRDLQEKTKPQTLSFLQEWLYFGPLHSFLDIAGLEFRHEDFVIQLEDGKRWITTAKLPHYLRKYRSILDAAKPSLSVEEQTRKRQEIALCFETQLRFASQYCQRETDAANYGPMPPFWPMTPELSLSIGVLGAALFLTSSGWNTASLSWKFCAWGLADIMLASGWCPSVVTELAAVDDLYTAHTLGRPVVPADHFDRQCNLRVCNTNQVDEGTYETAHVVDDCTGCKFEGPPMDLVVQRLRDGFIPAIEVHESNGGVEVRIVKGPDQHNPTVRHVAISHVWSDGLGNPRANELPTCQLRRLQNLANAASASTSGIPTAWWCDTLCVPVNPDLWEDRKLAIQKIAQVFREAECALALDRSLLQTSVNAEPLEVFMRLRLSNWMRRVWTLSEGILASRGAAAATSIRVQLQDGFKDIHSICRVVQLQEQSSGRILYSTYSGLSRIAFAPMLQVYESLQRPRSFQVFDTWRAIRRRATSRRRDETLCMANILGLGGLNELLEMDSQDFQGQMIWFLGAAGSVLVDILFQPCERLSVIGFRWAPVSFLSCFANTEWQNGGFFETGNIGPNGRGLVFQRRGLRFTKGEVPFPLIGEDILISHNQSSEVLYMGYFHGTEDRRTLNVDGSRDLKAPAVILGHDVTSRAKTFGVLVDVFAEAEDGRISCYYITRVGVTLSSERASTASLQQLAAALTETTQEWLVM